MFETGEYISVFADLFYFGKNPYSWCVEQISILKALKKRKGGKKNV